MPVILNIFVIYILTGVSLPYPVFCKLRQNLLPLRHAGSDQGRQIQHSRPSRTGSRTHSEGIQGWGEGVRKRGTQSPPLFDPFCGQLPTETDPCAIAGVGVDSWRLGRGG